MKPRSLFLIVMLLMVVVSACGQSADSTPAPADVSMTVRVEPQPLTVGETTLIITLKNGDGSPIDGATLRVHGDMDHEGMVAINRETAQSTNGDYHVPFEWTMGGGWIITISAQLPANGGTVEERYEYFVEAASSQSIINQHARPTTAHAENAVIIAYEPDPNPPTDGYATITILLLSEQGSPIADATIAVVGDMPRHHMLPIRGAGTHTENGRYSVPLRWTMDGDWVLTVTVTLADGTTISKDFNQHVFIP